ncbi:hypothetical protein, partial [Phytoactinopolyspora endophytica]|uniref:hypothetical protein n=1 Tax=Phytoactinopolyspora endophytica TaxID=1642495 RepID=UPI00197B354E
GGQVADRSRGQVARTGRAEWAKRSPGGGLRWAYELGRFVARLGLSLAISSPNPRDFLSRFCASAEPGIHYRFLCRYG